ncbi:MAG: aspartate carbamoyltransferase [Myxococcales bacterium]|nr:aspartate carbamoyltransferase [Myxococcales bacterium]|tara:strand:- start:460 stop:1446 length:987 start_codon:yes stop_codon:yes gene_type:complete
MSQVTNLPQGTLSVSHLLGIDGLTQEDVLLILQTAKAFSKVNDRNLKKVPFLRGHTVANLFFEASTRTRTSFELAAKRLSADTIQFNASTSSLKKGETLLDTGRTLEAMNPNLVVVRHSQAGAPQMLTQVMTGAIINAGDGAHEHPTQALLDAFTLMSHFDRSSEEGLKGLKIAIIGDIAHSRVARSNMLCLRLLGAEVRVAGPGTMLPQALEQYGVAAFTDVDEALESVDAVMMLRIQKERIAEPLMASEREYFRHFGLTVKRLAKLPEHAIVMHPGPMNRGVEIAPQVADDPRSVILQQAENGIAVRMAVLYLLALGQQNEHRGTR